MRPPPRNQAGFTLLEVMVALAILAMSVVVLVGSQGNAVRWFLEAEQMTTATQLADDVMSLALLRFELEGFGEGDIEEDGDFSSGPWEEYDNRYDNFRWEYRLQRITIEQSMIDNLTALTGAGQAEETGVSTQEDAAADAMSALGFTPEMFTELMGDYIRVLTVDVFYKLTEDSENEEIITLVTHIANPSGRNLAEEEAVEAEEDAEELEDLGFGSALTDPEPEENN